MKQEERVNKILTYLLEKRRARWSDLHRNLNIASKELSYDLKGLLNKRKIMAEKDAKDRRVTWYMPIRSKALMETRRYLATQFIENMENPIFTEAGPLAKGRFNISVSWFGEAPYLDQEKEKQNLEVKANKALREFQHEYVKVLEPFVNVKKVAIVFMLERVG